MRKYRALGSELPQDFSVFLHRLGHEAAHPLGGILLHFPSDVGVDAKTVSSILGHYSAGFTLDTYTHVTGEMQKDAAQRMGSFMAQTV